jgi:pyruvate/2-oxoglutarate dehydrogenase complex dihydrolipoamide acyltransferase (E2) component
LIPETYSESYSETVMAKPLHTPRVNNNDDTVQVIAIHVAAGDRVDRGAILAEVETDKSVSEVEAEQDGYVLDVRCAVDDRIEVDSVMMWIGDSANEPIPETAAAAETVVTGKSSGRPTAKARLLLREYGLSADRVPTAGDRLGAAFLEIEYDPSVWEPVAADYAKKHGLMLSPLLPLMAYRLVQLTGEKPRLNSTIVGERRYRYTPINLGFTVQAGSTLYLTVIEDAGAMDVDRFISAMGEVQRHALAHKLKPSESRGATIAFSSMSRWGVTRHQPILPPNTALMVAHAATGGHGKAVLGASYDHRVLTEFDVALLLRELAKPPVLD